MSKTDYWSYLSYRKSLMKCKGENRMDKQPLLGKNYQTSEISYKNTKKEAFKENYAYQKAINSRTISREQRESAEKTSLFLTDLFQSKDGDHKKIEQYHARMVGLESVKSAKQSFINEECKSYLLYWATIFKTGSLAKDAGMLRNTQPALLQRLGVSLEKSATFLTSKYGTIRSLYELGVNTKSSFLVYPAFFATEHAKERNIGGIFVRKTDHANYEVFVIDQKNTHFRCIKNKELKNFLVHESNVVLTRYLVPTDRTHLIADLLTRGAENKNKYGIYDELERISTDKEFHKYEEVDIADKGDIKNFECAVNYVVCSGIFDKDLSKEMQMLSLPENVKIIQQFVIDHLTRIEQNSPTFTKKQKNNLEEALKNIKASSFSNEKNLKSVNEQQKMEKKKLDVSQKSMDAIRKYRKLTAKSDGIDNPAFHEKTHLSESPTI